MLEFILQVISRSSKEAGYLSQVTQKSATKAEGVFEENCTEEWLWSHKLFLR